MMDYSTYMEKYGDGTNLVPVHLIDMAFLVDSSSLPSWYPPNPLALTYSEVSAPFLPEDAPLDECKELCVKAIKSIYRHFGISYYKKYANLYPSSRSRNLGMQVEIFKRDNVSPMRWYYTMVKKTVESAAYTSTSAPNKMKFRLSMLHKAVLSVNMLEDKKKRYLQKLLASRLKGGQAITPPAGRKELVDRIANIHTIAKLWFKKKPAPYMTSKHLAAFVWLDRYGTDKTEKPDPIEILISEYKSLDNAYQAIYAKHVKSMENFELYWGPAA